MKRIGSLSIAVAVIAAALIGGCKSSKPQDKAPAGETEVAVPCSGPGFWTDNKVFRANSLGESMDLVTAKKKALTNARNDLAQAIQTTVKTVTDNYTNSTSVDKREQLEQKFESLNREVVDQTLQGVRTICEKNFVTKDGNYKYYVALELSADDLVKQYNSRITADEKLKVDYDYEKFKDTFNKEMDKMAAQKNGGN